ncbi:ubiquitin carboxyl-terminal hydrolase 18 isoform X3 [Oryza sativa Japonica Group]|uniref:ubiquitin carboxyl-terminal hydrolase 18 isoform X3 n=1 Tax=Oryza sativa subsp. japonica TaxID=39947 RepID=UPI000E1C0F04|nr:ubiquitin carboxyl-terminal hydrolase 18 isoform X3 [Oryza sativa Japonica Group]XP_025877215.1 ubiquitin carboxyl-terminal hydrolase 18 isoform X3 [Oryza sativa Japonica Group]XP_025877216.1 ubiquitin carboxyl-terminal hydrolase 18 isoform X3 [Oryza sativa Japonica Group]
MRKISNCFGNVVLQCLAITEPFVSRLFGQQFGEECLGNCHACDLRRDLKRIRKTGAPAFFPTIFKHIRSLGGDFEDGLGRHRDSSEFLLLLLQKLFDGTHGCLTDMFGGKFRRSKVCSKCGMLSNSEEDFTLLMFNIPHREQVVAATLEDCLDHIVEENVHDSLSRCESCMNDQKSTSKCTFHETRDVVIVLQRFEPLTLGGYRKIGELINFPTELDISPYMSGVVTDKHIYELFGIIVHEGGVIGGHYRSYVKTNCWYEVSDRDVKRVNENFVLGAQAYILFYNRKEEAKSFDEVLAFAATAMSSSDAVPTSTSKDYTERTLSPEVSSAALSCWIDAARVLEPKSYSDQDILEKYIICMDRDSSDVSERIRNAMRNCNESRQEYHFNLPTTDGPFYDDNLGQYCLLRGARFRTISTSSNVEAKRDRAVRMHFLLSEILKLLQLKKVIDVGAIGYLEKFKFGNYSRSALLRRINDACMLLGTNRLSLNISVMSRGSIIGPVLFKVGEDVMIDASLRAVQIPHDIHLVDHIKLKKPVSFVLVVEKLSIFNMLVNLNFHVTHNCIIITGCGKPDMATRGAVFKLNYCLPVKVYILADLDLDGLQIYL